MDLPPYVPDEAQSRSSLYRVGQRRLSVYLEEQIEYVAGELLTIDAALGATIGGEVAPAQMVRLGHALHAVEDYSFIQTISSSCDCGGCWRDNRVAVPRRPSGCGGGHGTLRGNAIGGTVRGAGPTPATAADAAPALSAIHA